MGKITAGMAKKTRISRGSEAPKRMKGAAGGLVCDAGILDIGSIVW
jgi:hypothetical protein